MGPVRILVLLAVLGVWKAASTLLEAPLVVTALVTLGAAALGAWAIAVLREG